MTKKKTLLERVPGRLQPRFGFAPSPRDEIDPDIANFQREIGGSGKFYYEIDALEGWTSNTVYWEGFPGDGDSLELEVAEHVGKGAKPPASSEATQFAMGDWKTYGHAQIDATVGEDDVKYIYWLSTTPAGYLVVKQKDEKYSLQWYCSSSKRPESLCDTRSQLTLAPQSSISATAEDGERWWRAVDDER